VFVCNFNAFMDYSGIHPMTKIVVCLFKDKIKINIFKEKRSKIINVIFIIYARKNLMYYILFQL
jgi:hypothetical protein